MDVILSKIGIKVIGDIIRYTTNTGTRALRTLGAGMMAGATSPSKTLGFGLGTADPVLNDMHL